MIIPLTIQYLGSILEGNKKKQINVIDTNAPLTREHNDDEIVLFKYRIMFNFSVFLTILGSSLPLVIYMTQRNKDSKLPYSPFELFTNRWVICHVSEYLDMSSRIFFASMVTIPSLIILSYLIFRIPQRNWIFFVVYILSWIFFVVAYTSPLYLIITGFEKSWMNNGTIAYCSPTPNRGRIFELIACHVIPLAILIPSIIFEKCKLKFISNDRLYERLIFIVTNIPIAFIDTIEQTTYKTSEKSSYFSSYSNFYMICVLMYHLGYTSMFLVWPILSMIAEIRDESGHKFELNSAYKVITSRKSMRKTMEHQFSSIRD